MSADSVRDDALGTVAEWLPGYTFPDHGPQSRIRLVGEGEDHVTVSYETPACGGDVKLFRVKVQVEEV